LLFSGFLVVTGLVSERRFLTIFLMSLHYPQSSILCAVCLGLGGEPRLLGRASEVESFIQTGEDEAYIEIELANEKGKNPVITRTIRNEEGKVHAKSIYTWDGEVVSAKRVRERAAQEYQIQIDNLCTFLPQEKVGNFSGFDSKMLLLETEKTLSPNKHLFEEHQRLIRLQEELHGGDDQVESLQQRLEHLKKDLSRMEREVKRMEELEEDRKMADLLEKKILWLKSKELEEACVLLRAQKEKIKEQYREGMEEIKPLEQAHQKAVQKLEDARMELQRYESEVTGHKKEMERQKEKYETHDDRIEEILSELHSLEDNRAKLEKRVEDARTKVQELERMVDSRPASLEDLEAEKKRLIEEKQSLQEEYNRKRDREHEMSIQKSELENDMKVTQRDLARLNDEKAVLRQRFFVGNPDTQRAYDWIQANRAQFRREVLGPIACEVNLESDETAAYLEQHVSNNVLKSFVVGDKSDYNLLYNEVRVRQKIPINIIVIERVPEPKPRMYSHEKMDILKREHGIVGYLDETFQAPEVVMEALKSSSQIEKVLVGTNQTQISMDDKNLGGFLSESENGGRRTQGFCVFTADKGKSFKYLATVSKYSGYLNMRVDDVRAAKWLKRGTNEERKQEKERRLKEQKRHLEELIPSWNVAKNEHDDSLQSLQDAQGSVNQVTQQIQLSQKCITKLRSARLKLENFEAQLAVDDEKEKSDKIEHLNQRIRNSLKALKAHSASYKRMLAATVSASGARLLKEAAVNEERTCK
jgi:predicted  nucleic acid-binding Zn-ribbon protein